MQFFHLFRQFTEQTIDTRGQTHWEVMHSWKEITCICLNERIICGCGGAADAVARTWFASALFRVCVCVCAHCIGYV